MRFLINLSRSLLRRKQRLHFPFTTFEFVSNLFAMFLHRSREVIRLHLPLRSQVLQQLHLALLFLGD